MKCFKKIIKKLHKPKEWELTIAKAIVDAFEKELFIQISKGQS